MESNLKNIDNKLKKLENTKNLSKKIKFSTNIQKNIDSSNKLIGDYKNKLEDIQKLEIKEDDYNLNEKDIKTLLEEINNLKNKIDEDVTINEKINFYSELKTKILICKKYYSSLELKVDYLSNT